MSHLPVDVLSQEQAERLITHPDQDDVFDLRDAAILAALYYAAATAGELANLNLRDVDDQVGELRVRNEQGGLRRVPLDGPLADVLCRYLEGSRKLLLAHGGGGQRQPAVFLTNKGQRVHVQDIRQILGAHSKAAGLKHAVNFNTLRLSRAWHMREAGESPEKIQRMLGAPSRSGRRLV